MRVAIITTAVCLSIVGLAEAQIANAAIKMPTNIPAQGLGPALKAFAQERDLQVLYFSQTVSGVRTNGASGELTTDEALTQLLGGTGLVYRYVDDKAVTILAAGTETRASPVTSDDPNGEQPASKEGKKSSSEGFRIAQVDGGASSQSSAVGTNTSVSAEDSKRVLEEIVVTAQKRVERLQDVPVPVVVINTRTLADNNQVRLQDYYSSVPGLSLTPIGGTSSPTLAIRGIISNQLTTPTVGVVIDDVPYGSSTSIGHGLIAPEIDPGDLARVEVLRGPQGTLYGASSMGGLLKYVTVDPTTDRLSGRVDAGLSGVHGGDDPGYRVSGAVNVPVDDTFAVRASGFYRKDPGYVDNVLTGEDDVNDGHAEGGYLSALWKLSDDFSLKLSALLQESKSDGSLYADPALGDLKQDFTRGTGTGDRHDEAYSAQINARVGDFDVVSITSYNYTHDFASVDFSRALPPYNALGATSSDVGSHAKKLSQELRVSISFDQKVDWLIGAFYTHEDSDILGTFVALDPSTGARTAMTFYDWDNSATFEEYAAFTDITVHFTDRFDIQIGARESEIRQGITQFQTGPLAGPTDVIIPEVKAKDNAFTYLFTPRFRVSEDFMLYARLASGYRAGMWNTGLLPPSVPLAIKPDKTQNYELGAKGNTLGHALSFDASIYYIDWKDIQVQALAGFFPYFVNGPTAKSQGVELSVEARPLRGLTLAAWVTWADAKLTSALPANASLYGVDGDRLPYSSQFSGYFSIKQGFPITDRIEGFLGASASYAGNRKGEFRLTATSPREEYAGYAKFDLRAGADYDSLTLNIFANNITDRRGGTGGGIGTFYPDVFTYIQPRTIGVNLSKTF